MDGLDDLMKDIQSAQVVKGKDDHKRREARKIDSEETSSIQNPLENREIEKVLQQLSNVMIDLADPSVREKINLNLSKIKYSKFIEYYLENAKLSHYSVETELNRMDFTVRYEGQETSNKSEIGDIFYDTRLDDIWRFANQSIYADLYIALEAYKCRQTNISIVAVSSRFIVDIDERKFKAESRFDIVVMNEKSANGKLKLGSVTGELTVSLLDRTLQQFIDPPTICVVFDDDLRNAARSILNTSNEPSDGSFTTRASALRPTVAKAANALLNIVAPPPPILPRSTSSGLSSMNETASTPFATPSGRSTCDSSEKSRQVNLPLTINESTSSSNSSSSGANGSNLGVLTESLMENVVGSFGRWIGAGQTSNGTSVGGLADLRKTLQENKQKEVRGTVVEQVQVEQRKVMSVSVEPAGGIKKLGDGSSGSAVVADASNDGDWDDDW